MSDDFEFFFPDLDPADSGNIPLPPNEVRFKEVKVEPVLDGGPVRVRIYTETTAFQKRPNMEVELFTQEGYEVASTSIIEAMQRKNVFTMHLRGAQQGEKYRLHIRLLYPEQPDSDQRDIEFDI